MFALLALFVLTATGLAEETTTAPSATLTPEQKQVLFEQIRQLDEQQRAIRQQEQTAQGELLEVRKKASELDRLLQGFLGQIERIETERNQLAKAIEEQKAAASKAQAELEKAMTAAEVARKAAEEAVKKAEEAEKLAKAAQEEAQKLAKLPGESEKKRTELAEKLPSLKVSAAEQQTRNDKFSTEVDRMIAIVREHQQQQRAQAGQVESLLRDAGEWISFSEQIAPIFHDRCIACHNIRNSQGRYNMSTYAALMSPGESGPAVEPGAAEESLLTILIEDGSMPKDSEPLTPEQVNLIKRWIALGARLDIAADPDTPLIRLMPHPEQPHPPETYRTAIPVTALAVHPGGKFVASSGYHEVLLWSLPDGRLVRRIGNVAERIRGLAFSPDGTQLAVASGTPGRIGELKIFNPDSGELLLTPFVAEDEMFSVAYSPDGTRLAASGATGVIAVVALQEAQTERLLLIEDHADWVNSIDWSADGQLLVSASRDKTAKVFDADSGRLRVTFGAHSRNVSQARWVGSGKQVVSVGEDRRLRIWNAEDGKEVRNLNVGSATGVLTVLDPDQALNAGADGKLQLHRLGEGKLEKQATIGNDWISAVARQPEQGILVIGDHAGWVHVLEQSNLADATPTTSWRAVPVTGDETIPNTP